MDPADFHDQIDKERLTAALRVAELKTHGKIYVYVSHRPIVDALAQAQRRFTRLGLHAIHHHRATVLIYLAPKTHKFAIIGDTAIHEICGDPLWNSLAESLSRDLKSGDITQALLNIISRIERTLIEHFPNSPKP